MISNRRVNILVTSLFIFCDSLCKMCVYLTVVRSLQASQEALKASGDSSHVTAVSGIGLVQMWHQRASHSLPPPLSLPVTLCLSLSHSLPLSVPLCFLFFFFFPSSFAFPQHPPSWRWCVSVLLRRPGPNVERTTPYQHHYHPPPSPDLLHIPRVSPFTASAAAAAAAATAAAATATAATASRLSPPPSILVRVSASSALWGRGGGRLDGIKNMLRWGAAHN